MRKRFTLLIDLFISFFKIGMFTLGGGYAMLSVILQEVTDNKRWVPEARMTDYLTLAQACPGIIGTNTATAVGWHTAGFFGALAATLGMAAPSVLIITIVAITFEGLSSWDIAMKAFKGIRAAVVALMLVAVLRLSKSSIHSKKQWIIVAAAAIAVIFFSVKPQYIILAAIAAGIVYCLLMGRKLGKCKR